MRAPDPLPLAESTRRRLDAMAAKQQADWRAPALAARLVRRGEAVWDAMVGAADVDDGDQPPTAATQFRMGSITKTFTAVLVMQCRDDGLLDLDDRLGDHLPTTRHGGLTVRRLLSHLSGLQREPVGEVWERPEGPHTEELLAGLEDAEAVLPPARLHHYSNLGYSMLGEAVARLRRQSWEEALRQRVLEPLGLTSTTVRRREPFARGYFTDPWADRVIPEPEFPGNAFAPAAELWSTVEDLGRWGAFLADPDESGESVLAGSTVEEMCHPQVVHDLDRWTLAWGLGLMLVRRGDRVLVGHDGAMPGFLAGLAVRRPEKVAGVVLVNTSAGADPGGLAADLALRLVDDEPEPVAPWRPGPPVPDHLAELVGHWWSEGTEYTFSVREGRLEVNPVDAPKRRPPAVLVEEGPDVFRVVSGREQGELLRVVRDSDGAVVRLYWATYPVTRDPRPFGA